LYRLVLQHAATFFAETEDAASADLPQAAKRMGATTVELKSSHVPILSHPRWT